MKVLRNTFLLSVLVIRHTTVNGETCEYPQVCPPPPAEPPLAPNNYPHTFNNFPLDQNRAPFNASDPNPGGSCGLTCTAPSQYPLGLLACLRKYFEDDQGVMPIVQVADSKFVHEQIFSSKVVFSPSTSLSEDEFDFEGYNRARFAQGGSRLPAAILYAENTKDVQMGVNCARANGYKISARGRGHAYDNLSVLDGTLVIDQQANCKMDDFMVEKEPLEGTNSIGASYLGRIRSPSGCTNAAFLVAVNDHFTHGLGVIGSCPSVGITGFFLNGGYGDVTPYAGLAADLIDEIEMVLYDGRIITATATENQDIFWASKGGTGGLGVITNFWERVVESPSQAYTYFGIIWGMHDLEITADLLMKFQDYLIEGGTKYGGGSDGTSYDGKYWFGMTGIYLGTVEDLLKEFGDAGLLDEKFVDAEVKPPPPNHYTTYGSLNRKPLCGDIFGEAPCEDKYATIPKSNFYFSESATQAEAQATNACVIYMNGPTSYLVFARSSTIVEDLQGYPSLCHELGIDHQAFCASQSDGGICAQNAAGSFSSSCDITEHHCMDPVVVDAILEAFANPLGPLNRKGPSTITGETITGEAILAVGLLLDAQGAGTGGLIVPALERDTFKKLLLHSGWGFNHLVHGAPLKVPHSPKVSSDSTGYPHRNAFYNLPTQSKTPEYIEILLQDRAYGGDAINLQIYGNYCPSPYIPNYETHVYGDQREELARIRTEYDPFGFFDSPRYPQRGRGLRRTVDREYFIQKPRKRGKSGKNPKSKAWQSLFKNSK